MSDLFKITEYGVISQPPPDQRQRCDCPRCGYYYEILKIPEMIDYKKAYEDYRSMYQKLIHEINDLMAYSEKTYGLNPSKDKLCDQLIKLREKFEKDY
jgi:hypothetical protein